MAHYFIRLYCLFSVCVFVPVRTLFLEHYSRTYIFTSAGVLISALVLNWHFKFPWKEPCGQTWHTFKATALDAHFKEHLYGQHLVSSIVPKLIETHILNPEPAKALVMSFHGWTGTGKTYVANMIAESLFENGPESDFVHWYVATRDFPDHSLTIKYQDRLQQELVKYTERCGQSLFIFDEIEKLQPGIIDAILPFIDLYDEAKALNYRRHIFIFLSTTGGMDITKVAFSFWLEGKDREDITLRDVEPLVSKSALYRKGGWQHSELMKKNLVDILVPFFPLAKSHVKKCIIHELKVNGKNASQHVVQRVANQMLYYPPQFESFSVSGCKKVSQKIALYGS